MCLNLLSVKRPIRADRQVCRQERVGTFLWLAASNRCKEVAKSFCAARHRSSYLDPRVSGEVTDPDDGLGPGLMVGYHSTAHGPGYSTHGGKFASTISTTPPSPSTPICAPTESRSNTAASPSWLSLLADSESTFGAGRAPATRKGLQSLDQPRSCDISDGTGHRKRNTNVGLRTSSGTECSSDTLGVMA